MLNFICGTTNIGPISYWSVCDPVNKKSIAEGEFAIHVLKTTPNPEFSKKQKILAVDESDKENQKPVNQYSKRTFEDAFLFQQRKSPPKKRCQSLVVTSLKNSSDDLQSPDDHYLQSENLSNFLSPSVKSKNPKAKTETPLINSPVFSSNHRKYSHFEEINHPLSKKFKKSDNLEGFDKRADQLIKLNLPLEKTELIKLLKEVDELKIKLHTQVKVENFPVVILLERNNEELRIEAYSPDEILLIFPSSTEKTKYINKGNSKSVHHAWNLSTPKHVAYSTIYLDTQTGEYNHTLAKRVQSEAKILNSLRESSCCPKIYKSFFFLNANKPYQVIVEKFFPANLGEIINNANQTKLLNNFLLSIYSDQQKINFAIKLLKAVSCLHQQKIVHRDLKPDNILIKQNKETEELTPIICDFDMAVSSDDYENVVKGAGAMEYSAIESLENNIQPNSEAAFALDIWSLGCVFYDLFGSGVTPWCASLDKLPLNILDNKLKAQQLAKELIIKEYNNFHHQGPYLEAPLKNLVWQMLHLDPYQRPSLETITNFLENEFNKLGQKESYVSPFQFI